jgi:hypothetical protein
MGAFFVSAGIPERYERHSAQAAASSAESGKIQIMSVILAFISLFFAEIFRLPC